MSGRTRSNLKVSAITPLKVEGEKVEGAYKVTFTPNTSNGAQAAYPVARKMATRKFGDNGDAIRRGREVFITANANAYKVVSDTFKVKGRGGKVKYNFDELLNDES